MRYKSQSVAYWYFAVAMVLFGLQLVFGLLSATKYLGPDPLLNILPFDVTKVIHTNLLIVWVLTGFMGATYWMVPDESRTELHSTKLAYIQLGLWTAMGVTAIIGYLFGYGTGNKLLEQPLPHKIVIVICMLIFLYNIGMTIKKSGRFTTTEGVLLLGLVSSAVLFFPALLHYENYTVSIFYRWWTIHLWVEGVWMMIMGAFLAYLLIRLSGADREVLEKWLYVIVGLVFIAGIIGTAHHYYWVGVPHYWLPIGGFFSALEPLAIIGMAMYAYSAMRRSGMAHPNSLALHWTLGSTIFTLFGAGLLGLAHTWPSINKWTHGTLITAMHGHAAFYGAYAMIVLAMITYALPSLTNKRPEQGTTIGYWAFWLQLAGMFGMTLSFATAGIGQVYLERIMGMGYLDTQLKIQIHFVMLISTASIFALGVGLFIYDFFSYRPRFEVDEQELTEPGMPADRAV
ncbi:cbb3-type cytochrome c oxidase subunit I [Stutzerimonas xanthomarina]|uniref:Nitric oxide reductase, NorB subunit apoprotein n=2 Tax=Stutzerimonas xanthomarina TaxID=271420 RepID=A0A1M5QES1_9GAMM|nr:cbb3-type cytochrome c oxidase subunit I [Stutzerimonas xanthomarina]MCP9339454.1 cbb3-type cytochrome c oxidase subunit I [Stutzerimonas xanthomarina]SEH65392.1 nitric oxide reductase subunit B [Stutzerimonas xanthomarina]SHH12714.1 nitric oxide reductase, NorB subunit apoprotein [Stutzerimonas xanthomarina DSM 18231]